MVQTIREQMFYQSPIGLLLVQATDGYIVKIDFVQENSVNHSYQNSDYHSILAECTSQLDLYFKGKLRDFSVKCRIHGTDFQKRVWQELSKIPFGTTISYSDLAKRINYPKAVRAVGGANNKNKLPIIIPCHRVIGKDASLTGYAGGLWRKEWLLNHERQNSEGRWNTSEGRPQRAASRPQTRSINA